MSNLQRIEALFQQAVDLPPAERADLLDGQCGGDAQLRALIERLLWAHEQALPRAPAFLAPVPLHVDDPIDPPPQQPSAPPASTSDWPKPPDMAAELPDFLQPGRTWGKYVIEGFLGQGGQAVVLQAFDRFGAVGHVALKVARSSLPPDQAEAWARAEAEPLARLNHPHIVRVVDAGCNDGIPYIATRLLDPGTLPLDTYVNTSPPTERQIARWMAHLADARRHVDREPVPTWPTMITARSRSRRSSSLDVPRLASGLGPHSSATA